MEHLSNNSIWTHEWMVESKQLCIVLLSVLCCVCCFMYMYYLPGGWYYGDVYVPRSPGERSPGRQVGGY